MRKLNKSDNATKRIEFTLEEEFSYLTAIWIMASNDDSSIISFESVRYRLNLNHTDQIKSLVLKKRELFRLGASRSQLEKWKADMRAGLNRPRWIAEIPKEEDRVQKINSIDQNSVFRSQFRAKKDADRSQIEIIEWGIEHLESQFTFANDLKERKDRIVASIWVPLGSLLVTVVITGATLFYNHSLQSRTLELQNKIAYSQNELKRNEIFFKSGQGTYTHFMNCLYDVHDKALNEEPHALEESLKMLDRSFYELEPYADSLEQLNSMKLKYNQFVTVAARAREIHGDNAARLLFNDSLNKYMDSLHATVFPLLFGSKK